MVHLPLFIDLARRLRQQLAAEYSIGDVFPGEMELAKRFDVSIVTMRQALASLAQEGLLERRQGRGTFVRQLPARPVVAIYTEHNIFNPQISRWHSYLVGYTRQSLDELGIANRVFVGRRDAMNMHDSRTPPVTCPEFLRFIHSDEVAGVINISTNPHPLWTEPLERRGLPIVGTTPFNPIRVRRDAMLPLRHALNELIGTGRKNFGLLFWDDPTTPAGEYLRQTFTEHLRSRGLSVHPEWMRGDLYPTLPGSGWEEFREIWTSARAKPDALVIADDCLIPDVATVIRELHLRVPEQLSLVGFTSRGVLLPHGLPMARIESDPEIDGRGLAQLMRESLAGDRSPRTKESIMRWIPPEQAAAPVAERASVINAVHHQR